MAKTRSSISIVVKLELAGLRLDVLLGRHEQIGSRSLAQKLIQNKLVTVNKEQEKASCILQEGDIIEATLITENKNVLKPKEGILDILFEDDDLIVINKPANLVVHPANGHWDDTLVNLLIHHTKNLSMGFGENRPGIVHRLDKDTSGLLVIAKNNIAHQELSEQFKQRTAHRLYTALVLGHIKNEGGRITSLLQRHPTQRKKFHSSATGKSAITNYKTLKHYENGLRLVELKLETGRTHQIRVHLSELGAPVVGDTLYGADKKLKQLKSKKLISRFKELNRIFLHAKTLGFTHPRTKEWLEFQKEIPPELQELLNEI